jgi:16S rRNA (cytosine967-C5)-methyltransferase
MNSLYPPIERAVVSALKLIFLEHRHADKVVEKNLRENRKWGSRDRHQFAETVYEIVRWWRLYIHLYLKRDLNADGQIAISDDEILTLVRTYVEKRNIEDEGPLIDHRLELPVAVRESIPDHLWQLLQKEVGEEARDLVRALNKKAPQYLRVNSLKTTRAEVIKRLAEEGIQAVEVQTVSSAVRLSHRKNVFQTQSYKGGFFEMQDAGSQMIAPLLAVKPGDRVVDACAGAGGKTLHLAAMMQNKGRIVALDIHQHKLDELKLRGRRAGVSVIETRLIENSKTIKRLEDSADAVLLDVPCSGLGVLRRYPDTKWKFSSETLENLIKTQTEILSQYVTMAKVGGAIVYATCSVLPSENGRRVREYIERNTGVLEIEEEINVSPIGTEFDGFYAVRLRRRG